MQECSAWRVDDGICPVAQKHVTDGCVENEEVTTDLPSRLLGQRWSHGPGSCWGA